MAVEHVQTATIANKKNMERRDPQTRRKYREEMKRAGDDPLLAKNFLMRTSLVECLRDQRSQSRACRLFMRKNPVGARAGNVGSRACRSDDDRFPHVPFPVSAPG